MTEASALMKSSIVFEIEKLNNSNYQVWKFRLECLLKREKTWKMITTARPASGLEEIEEWDTCDNKAFGTIGLLIEESQIPHVQGQTTAKGVWDTLKNYHEKASRLDEQPMGKKVGINKLKLIGDLLQQKYYEEDDLEEHISRIQELIDHLVSLGNKSFIELGPWIVLHSMPESYHTWVSDLASRPEEQLNFDIVKATLIDANRMHNVEKALEQNLNPCDELCEICYKRGHNRSQCQEIWPYMVYCKNEPELLFEEIDTCGTVKKILKKMARERKLEKRKSEELCSETTNGVKKP